MLWIEQGRGPVPIEFGRLVETLVTNSELRRAIDDLLKAKRAGDELDRGPWIPVISRFIETEMTRLDPTRISRPARAAPVAELNALFRLVLIEVWGNQVPSSRFQVPGSGL
jgi:predicted nucleotidyltransferase